MVIQIPILNNEYIVIVSFGTAKQHLSVLKKYDYEDLTVEDTTFDGFRGFCFSGNNKHPVIIMPFPPDTPQSIATLAHEAVHAVDAIVKTIDERGATEFHAHSVGAIVRITLETVEKIKKGKKNAKKKPNAANGTAK